MPAFIETRQAIAIDVSLHEAWDEQIAATRMLHNDLRQERLVWRAAEDRLSDLFSRLRTRLK
ncbi:MAG: hypothetical protein KDA69_22210 [Planctomycetaceae bacterium]|nr:hypothetical protein [Planctomycetaceae bacterium]MCB9949628.1 hypothetical protein [Planctomycetaceae bacterium]